VNQDFGDLRLAEGSGRPLGTAEFVAGLERLPGSCHHVYLRGEVCALSALCAIRVGFGGVCAGFLVLGRLYVDL
jgi:hypothetical protein